MSSATPYLDSLFSGPAVMDVDLSDDDVARIPARRPGRPQAESPSSITRFRHCPGTWYAERYVLPRQPSGMAAVAGTFVHRILECFYNGPEDEWTYDALERQFKRAWRELKGEATPVIITPDLQQEYELLDSGETEHWFHPGAFYKRARASIENVPVIDGDMRGLNIVSNEAWGRLEHGGIVVNGKIDRIRLTDDGDEIIEDWKTGRDPKDTEPVRVTSPTFVPVGLYALMRQKAAEEQGRAVDSVSLYYLQSGNEYTIPADEGMLDEAHQVLSSATGAMLEVQREMVLPLSPSEDNCRFCPIKKVCPARGGKDAAETYQDALESVK